MYHARKKVSTQKSELPTKRRKIPFTTREMIWKKKKTMKRSTRKPYWLKKILIELREAGSKEKRIWEPSKGGMGSKLKTAKRMFMYAIYPKSKARLGFST